MQVESAILSYIQEEHNSHDLIIRRWASGIYISAIQLDRLLCLIRVGVDGQHIRINAEYPYYMEYAYDLCDPDSLIKVDKIIEDVIECYQRRHELYEDG